MTLFYMTAIYSIPITILSSYTHSFHTVRDSRISNETSLLPDQELCVEFYRTFFTSPAFIEIDHFSSPAFL